MRRPKTWLYYALRSGSIKLSQLSGGHGLITSLLYMETMLNQSAYICKPLTAKKTYLQTKGIIAKPWVRQGTICSWIFFWWNKNLEICWFYVTNEDWSELCWKDLFNTWGFRKMLRLAYMVCLKQTQLLLCFATVQRWKSVNIE